MDINKATKSALDYLQSGNSQEAENIFRDILKVQPNNVTALHFIGVIYYQLKDYSSAIRYIKKALQFGPDYADAYNNLGSVLQETGRFDKAITCYQKAININPNFDRAYYNLGTALKEKWLIDEAIEQYQKAIQLNPYLVEAYNNLGLALQDQGKVEEAEKYYRHGLRLKPDFPLCHSNLLLLMNYNSRHNAQSVFSEHLQFAKNIAGPLYPSNPQYPNDSSPSRRLKIGYVSPDFRRHSVNYFIEPVLASHDHGQFEVFCYSDVLISDNVTKQLHGYADQWRDIAGMPDEKVTELIRRDGIDILIDLAGHTGYNRMLLFARKPAPVQVSWLGYPNTTGLATVDYRLVDEYTDPQGLTDPFYTEKLMRLPGSFLCYLPDKESPVVGDLPALKSGHVTFGSFNYFPKVSEKTVVVWAAILNSLPDSRLIMKSRNFSDSTACRYALEMFIKHGIAAGRIELISVKSSFTEHLDTYNRIDIGLDTFPYNGTTTTCEAIWMGVPVIALSGITHASRVGLSLLANLGLEELVAGTFEEYISIAVGLAVDLDRLQELRKSLRDRLAHSPLTNAKRFSINLETCYREMWAQWCTHRHISLYAGKDRV
jgi:predicted O-linked N-acetylglucosamine transferase (SPINDLY family)